MQHLGLTIDSVAAMEALSTAVVQAAGGICPPAGCEQDKENIALRHDSEEEEEEEPESSLPSTLEGSHLQINLLSEVLTFRS